jgi:hypothetical protein
MRPETKKELVQFLNALGKLLQAFGRMQGGTRRRKTRRRKW